MVRYILISTDSVYDVCVPHEGPMTEDMSVRDMAKYDVLKKEEEYGHDKLKCEECLSLYGPEFPYVILRFPDIIGAYDDTGRFWAYVKWI
jgi:nucleoside-diphosphate-sugar epimerase